MIEHPAPITQSRPIRKRTACVVTADDGTFGLGITTHGGPVEQIINGHFAPILQGQDCMATEKAWDMMRRSSAQYGSAGLASYAYRELGWRRVALLVRLDETSRHARAVVHPRGL